jgi:transcriptional regulator with XRE-family HTH domain
MTRKRKLMLAIAGLAVAVVAVPLGLHVWSQRHAPGRFIDQEHCARIKKGMTQEEVEAILGVPPGVYTKKQLFFFDMRSFSMLGAGERVATWTGDQGLVDVVFDEHGAVEFSQFEQGTELRGPSYLEQILTWLRPPATVRGTFKSAPIPWTQPETPPSAP